MACALARFGTEAASGRFPHVCRGFLRDGGLRPASLGLAKTSKRAPEAELRRPYSARRVTTISGMGPVTQSADVDIRVLRVAAGLSQEKLAQLADVSTSTVRLHEAGYRPTGGRSFARDRMLAVLLNDERPEAGTRVARETSAAEGGLPVELYAP